MTIIYVVIDFYGSEEATPMGLFSTRVLAEEAKKNNPFAEIKEYYLDPFTENPSGQEFWYVKVVSGEIRDCFAVKPCYAIPPLRELCITSQGDVLSTSHCWANNEKQAKSIALNDYYEQTCTITSALNGVVKL